MSRIPISRRARWTAASGTLLVAAIAASMLTGSGPANADPLHRSDHTVSVSGTGRVSATPDIMHVDLGVQRTSRDLNAALHDANADIARIKEVLGKHGVKDADIQTSQLSINQHYGPIQSMATPAVEPVPPANAPTAMSSASPAVAPDIAVAPVPPSDQNAPNGYDVFETMAVTIRNLSDAGATISDAAAAGGDATRINGVSFDVDDQTALLQQARAAAFADAKKKAEQYASLAGRSLGQVSVITENAGTGGGVVYPMARNAMGSAVPVSPGSQEVTLTTTVTWELS
jgi:uncharacterized protein YggE